MTTNVCLVICFMYLSFKLKYIHIYSLNVKPEWSRYLCLNFLIAKKLLGGLVLGVRPHYYMYVPRYTHTFASSKIVDNYLFINFLSLLWVVKKKDRGKDDAVFSLLLFEGFNDLSGVRWSSGQTIGVRVLVSSPSAALNFLYLRYIYYFHHPNFFYSFGLEEKDMVCTFYPSTSSNKSTRAYILVALQRSQRVRHITVKGRVFR